jgi:hypothetical protein
MRRAINKYRNLVASEQFQKAALNVTNNLTGLNGSSSQPVPKTPAFTYNQIRSASTVTNITRKISTKGKDGVISINGLEIPQTSPKIVSTFELQPDNSDSLYNSDSAVFRYEPSDLYSLKSDKPQIVVICEKDATLSYGKLGTNPNLNKPKPSDILDEQLIIPKGYNIIDVPPMVPFQIRGKDYQVKKLLRHKDYGEFKEVLSAKESIRSVEVDKILDLSYKNAEVIAATLQGLIFAHPKQGTFGPEATGPIVPPSKFSEQSLTLMRFHDSKSNTESSSPCHFHLSKRMLIIVTTNEPASATFYTSGIAEKIDEQSPKISVNFEKNSIYSLTFPTGTHHQFHGYLFAGSFHAYDSPNVMTKLSEMFSIKSDVGNNLLSINTVDSTFAASYLASKDLERNGYER